MQIDEDVINKLRGIAALRIKMTADALTHYNEGWSHILAERAGDIIAEGAKAAHKKENPESVFGRLAEEHKTHGCLMYCIHSQALLTKEITQEEEDIEKYVRLPILYLQQKRTFRKEVDKLYVGVFKIVKNARRYKRTGLDPTREAEYNERSHMYAKAKKAILHEAEEMRKLGKWIMRAADKHIETHKEIDPAFLEAQKAIEPSPAEINRWIEQFVQMDEKEKKRDWGGLSDNYVSRMREDYVAQKRIEYLQDDENWERFVAVSQKEIQKKIKDREVLAERFREATVRKQINKLFPDLDPEDEGTDRDAEKYIESDEE